MSTVDDRMAEIEKDAKPGGYCARLIEVTGSVRSAALLDLALDGDTYYPDMRRRPFVGDEELKTLYREAAAAHSRLCAAIMARIWEGQ